MTVEHRKLLGDVKEEELVETEINEKDYQMIVFESAMLEFINEQHYHGLAQTGDMETPAKLKKGMSGIATCYEKELFQQVFVTNTRSLLLTTSVSITFPLL